MLRDDCEEHMVPLFIIDSSSEKTCLMSLNIVDCMLEQDKNRDIYFYMCILDFDKTKIGMIGSHKQLRKNTKQQFLGRMRIIKS